MDINRIVEVTITRQTTVPGIPSFSNVLLAGEFLASAVTPVFGVSERVREYGGLTEIATAFGTTSDVYYAAKQLFSQNPALNKLKVGRKLTGGDGTETWTAALTAIATEDNDWYGLLTLTLTLADQQLAAAWTEANKKLYGIPSADVNVVDGTGDIAEYINTQGYDRSFVIYHPDAALASALAPYPAAAWIGKQFPKNPGSSNWANQTLSGISAVALTGGQLSTIEGKKGNYYVSVAGVSITRLGTVGSGEYIDIIRGVDWLEARIQQLVFTPFIQQEKIPYTNTGVQIVVGQLKAALEEGVTRGLITADYTISYPDVANISAAEKAARNLPDITFNATLQGAINKTNIAGIVAL